MKANLAAGLAGLLFGLGLIISGMVNPLKVQNFLDVTGAWDPSLAFVMGGALVTAFFGYRWLSGWNKPLFVESFHWPTARDIDGRLVAGAGLFGAGWGLAGICPGPAITASTFGGSNLWVFLVAMLVTMALYRYINTSGWLSQNTTS